MPLPRRNDCVRGVALVFLALCFTSAAQAEPQPAPDARAEAASHYARAMELIEGRQFDAAIGELRRAYEIAPSPEVLYNLAVACIELGRSVEAVDAFERYLAAVGDSVTKERRAQVEGALADQRRHIARLTLHVEPEGAQLFIDGKPAGRSPLAGPVRLDAGTHVVAVELAGTRRIERSITLAGEEQRVVEIVAIQAGPTSEKRARGAHPVMTPTPTATPTSTPRQGEPRGGSLPKAGDPAIAYACLGAGAAGLVAGAAFWLERDSKLEARDGVCPSGVDCARGDQARVDELTTDARRATTLSVASLALGGALVGTGAVWIALSSRTRNGSATLPSRAWLEVGASRVTMGGQW